MKTNDKGIAIIKKYEGLWLVSYKCPAGKWTIGYGHTGKVDGKKICKGMTISKKQANELLEADIDNCEKSIKKYIKVPLTSNQLSALVSFTFNLGSGNLYVSTLRKKLNKGDYAGAVGEFQKWNKATVTEIINGKKVKKKKPLEGLTKRRKTECDLFCLK